MKRYLTIYLDFDGTVVEHAYPEIGAPNPGSLEVIRKLQEAGHSIILNTYRADIDVPSLEAAITYFEREELITFVCQIPYSELRRLRIKLLDIF